MKGLLIASLSHGADNALVTDVLRGFFSTTEFVLFVSLFDGFVYLLHLKLARYRNTYADAVEEGDGDGSEPHSSGPNATDPAATDESEPDERGPAEET